MFSGFAANSSFTAQTGMLESLFDNSSKCTKLITFVLNHEVCAINCSKSMHLCVTSWTIASIGVWQNNLIWCKHCDVTKQANEVRKIQHAAPLVWNLPQCMNVDLPPNASPKSVQNWFTNFTMIHKFWSPVQKGCKKAVTWKRPKLRPVHHKHVHKEKASRGTKC